MKKLIITILCASVCSFAAHAQQKPTQVQPVPAPQQASDPNAGKFKFEQETHDYGEVMEGPLAEYDFVFTNTGKKPIIISEAHGSCGCTVPQWPHEPILPGKKGTIHVSYNTTGRVGPIHKDVTITSNAQQSPMVLHITGTVKAKPAEAPAAAEPAKAQ